MFRFHILNFMIALAGCSIAAALAIGTPMSAAGTQVAMPRAEWRSFPGQRAFAAPCPERHRELVVSPIIDPIGPGWG